MLSEHRPSPLGIDLNAAEERQSKKDGDYWIVGHWPKHLDRSCVRGAAPSGVGFKLSDAPLNINPWP